MWKELYISLNNLSTYCDALEREKMYYNSNYDVNLTTVMITWRRKFMISLLVILFFPYDVIGLGVSVMSSK